MARRRACPRVPRRPRVGRAALGGQPAALHPHPNPYLDNSHARANDDHHGVDVAHAGADIPDPLADDPDPDHADPDPDAALQSAKHPDADAHPYGHPDA
jgi:hypothetical protein